MLRELELLIWEPSDTELLILGLRGPLGFRAAHSLFEAALGDTNAMLRVGEAEISYSLLSTRISK